MTTDPAIDNTGFRLTETETNVETSTTLRIEHVALWTPDLERLRRFYQRYFQATVSPKYHNTRTDFESYFLTFGSGARLEIMHSPEVVNDAGASKTGADAHKAAIGYAHLALSVGSKARVDALTAQLHTDGYTVTSLPRYTGDGYYESVILDPDGNRIEITV